MCLLRASPGEVRRRAVPVPMSVPGTYSNSSPTRHDLVFHNSKLKTGHQAPMESPQSKSTSSASTATAADALSTSHSDSTAGLLPANGAAASHLFSRTTRTSSADWTQRDWCINRVDDGMRQVHRNAETVLTATQPSSHSSSDSNGSVRDQNVPSDPAQAASLRAIREPSTAAAASVRQPQSPKERQPGAAVHESNEPRPAQHGDMSREVILNDEVKDFLAQPVSGPWRPIIFDLETTGTAIL